MIFKEIHKMFPFRKLLNLVFVMALLLQLVVITYTHFSGYQEVSSAGELAMRLTRGMLYSMLAGFAISYPDLYTIRYLNGRFRWIEHPYKRVAIQLTLMLLIAIIVASLLTLFANWVRNYSQGLMNVLFNNILIYSVVNSLFMTILEGWIYLDESQKERVRAESLQQELVKEAADKAMIEAQVQIEEEKNRHSRELKSILENLSGAVYRCHFDEGYTMEYISDNILDITGYEATEFAGNSEVTFGSIIHSDDRTLCRQNILDSIATRSHYEFEYRIIHKSGHTVWVGENGKGVFDDTGKLLYLDGLLVDITRRKEAEISAKESQRNYKELMHFLPQPVFELDIQGRILFNNRAGQAFFGLNDPEESEEKLSALDFFIPEDIPRLTENIKRPGQSGETTSNEYTVKKPDGSLCPVLIFGSPIVRNNRVAGRRGIIIDISERKRQEERILEAKEQLEKINNTLEQSVAERTRQLTEANTQLLKVQKENLQSQFAVLKQQVNPHFLFNSLNVLTSLIKIDPDLAESFTERLSKVYRYVLENKEKDLVSLTTELEFLNSYLFLLEIRFMKKISVDIRIDRSFNEYLVLPIAIQLLIENAVKHNTFSKAKPLKIEIFVDENMNLNIINNLNLRETRLASTGVGLENIKRRYALVSEREPEFIRTDDRFIARLPILNPDEIEKE